MIRRLRTMMAWTRSGAGAVARTVSPAWWRTAVLIMLTGVAGAGFSWAALRVAWPFPFARLAATPPATVFTDRTGQPVSATLARDEQWRIPVRLDHVSPQFLDAVLATEDHRFYRHRGIDTLAVIRAGLDNLLHARCRGGASTISMQLARLVQPEPRGWGAKLRQTFRALDLETQRDKEWILRHYVNALPFGGNIVGVEAAALCYFGKRARDLDLAEAALLAGIPQRPRALRPDRNPGAAAQRRSHVLNRMVATGRLDRARAREAARRPPLIAHAARSGNRLGIPQREPLFCRVAASAASEGRIGTSLDPDLQHVLRTTLRAHVAALRGVSDGAGVVLHNRSGEVRALVGTLDFAHPAAGQVNAATAPRSPGSALKPFVYAAALDGGLLVPETRVLDTPMAHPDYRPENYDRTYRGEVRAADALADSLNVPAIRLLQRVGPIRVLELLRSCGLRTLDRPAAHYGLSLTLGGAEVTLLDLTNAYAGLARGGEFRTPCFRARPPSCPPASTRPLTRGTVTLLTDMLSARPLPGAPRIPVAWKTGTSNGHRDAWCLAYNAELTIGIWIGNKSGTSKCALVGIEAAAPAVADVLLRIYDGRPPPPAQVRQGTEPVLLCPRTGLRATARTRDPIPAEKAIGVPLQCAPLHAAFHALDAAPAGQAPRILEPRPGTYLGNGQPLRFPLRAVAAAETPTWFLNGQCLGAARDIPPLPLPPGRHEIHCVLLNTGQSDTCVLVIR